MRVWLDLEGWLVGWLVGSEEGCDEGWRDGCPVGLVGPAARGGGGGDVFGGEGSGVG